MSKAIGNEHQPTSVPQQDNYCLVFGVENVDQTCLNLQAQGVQLLTTPQNRPEWGIRTAHLRDPDGNLIEINEPLTRE